MNPLTLDKNKQEKMQEKMQDKMQDKIHQLESELYLVKSLLDHVSESIYWKNTAGVYLGCNQAMVEKAELPCKEYIIGKTDSDCWPEQGDRLRQMDLEVLSMDKTITCKEPVLLKSGKQLYFLSVKSPLKNAQNETIGMIGRSVDITECVEAQHASEKAHLTKIQFLALMSHEFRTPLTGILTLSHVLKQEALEHNQPEIVQWAKNIKQCGESLLETVNEIFQFLALETKEFKLNNQPLHFQAVITRVTKVFQSVAEKKGLEFSVCYDPALPKRIIADAKCIRYILIGLITNAIKFTDHGKIAIHMKKAAPEKKSSSIPMNEMEIEISVSDTGMGIPAEKLDWIFESFTQLEDSYVRKSSAYGSGLGLTLIKKIVTGMKGVIQVSSKVGVGSTFTWINRFRFL